MRLIYTLLCSIITFSIYAQSESVIDLKNGKTDDVFILVDERPEFKGGEEELLKFYKNESKFKIADDREEGSTVYFQFVVDTAGSVSDPIILSSPSKEFSSEVERLVGLMPEWMPGKKDGASVKTKVTKEITFVVEQ